MKKIKIYSDGTALGTKVYDSVGNLIGGAITKIEIEPIEPNGVVSAKITFALVELEIAAAVEESRE